MINLPAAVKTRLDSLSGGEKTVKNFFNVAPAQDSVLMPWRVINQNPGTPPDYASDQNEALETIPIVIDVYAHDAVWIYEDLKRIQASFITTVLPLDSGAVILTEPGSYTVEVDPDRDDETGEEVYHGTLITDFTVQRQLQ